MTCSSETSQARPCASRELRAGAHHRRRAADVQLDGIAERPALERVAERHGDAAATPRLPSSVRARS
jgi:hypothetical protein